VKRFQSRSFFAGVAGMLLVLLPNAARADFSKTITVTPGVPTQAVATWYFANCTTVLGVGSYTINVAPNHGTVSFGGVSGVIPGCPSGSPSLPAVAAYYTWLDTTPGGSSDSFQLTYSVNGLSEIIDVTVNTTGPIPPPAAPTPPPGCDIQVFPLPVADPSNGPLPTYMTARFRAPEELIAYATSKPCGFDSFNWEQVITYLPSNDTQFYPLTPSLINPLNLTATCTIKAPPDISDPGPGSWAYLASVRTNPTCVDLTANSFNTYPFFRYVYPDSANGWYKPGCRCTLGGNVIGCTNSIPTSVCETNPAVPYQVSQDGATLGFTDAPGDSDLPGVAPSANPPEGSYIAFRTTLVGVSSMPSPGASSCATHDGNGNVVAPLYCTPLYVWTWNSTFNGCTGFGFFFRGNCDHGGVTVTSQTVGDYPVIPGSGTGGVTITSINGTQLPSAVLSSQIATTTSGLAFSRVSQTFSGTVTLRNISSTAISGPFQILFLGIPANVVLVNSTGNLTGTPYLTVPTVTSLSPGESVVTSVQFKNSSNGAITFTPAIYSGSIK
jgi:hypothetical protein